MAKTLFDKLWETHQITDLGDGEYLLNIDRIFLHERTGSIALKSLEQAQLPVVSPQDVFCTMDHLVSTKPGRGDITEMPGGEKFITATRESAIKANINLFDIDSSKHGIVHVISPQLGIAQPGITLVCPDSHTCSLGALGALAWGIGSSAAEHALATKTLRVSKPKTMRIWFDGELPKDVTAKDMILYLIGKIGTNGGAGYAIEFAGPAIRKLPIEARLTVCNMAVELSAFTGMIAPDQKTFEYVKDREYAPTGNDWKSAVAHWKTLPTDTEATFDKEVSIDSADIQRMVTWGTSPQDVVSVLGEVPHPGEYDSDNSGRADAMRKALEYMQLEPGVSVREIRIDAAFIGSCTNSRLSDLRLVADYLKGKTIAPDVAAICVPGSNAVKRAAEAEGIDKIFTDAGFEWRESGCSMCFYAGGETFGANKRVISSTNRNFESRQGPKTKTHLASPLTVAASACAGFIRGA